MNDEELARSWASLARPTEQEIERHAGALMDPDARTYRTEVAPPTFGNDGRQQLHSHMLTEPSQEREAGS